jgi:hypothetical protein
MALRSSTLEGALHAYDDLRAGRVRGRTVVVPRAMRGATPFSSTRPDMPKKVTDSSPT